MTFDDARGILPRNGGGASAARMARRVAFGATIVGSTLAIGAAAATAQTNWTGVLSENWLDAGNWTDGVPTAGSPVDINATLPNPTRIEGAAQSGAMRVGVNADGRLIISGGGSLASDATRLSGSANSFGEIIVTGAGSTWTNSSSLVVGDFGSAALSILDGASVSNTLATLAELHGVSATAIVSGNGSNWTNNGRLTVGERGEGRLEVLDGANVSSTTAHIGDLIDSSGVAIISGAGSQWNNSSYLAVGHRGVGELRIEDGGRVINPNGRVGYLDSATGSVTVSGPDSLWSNAGLTLGLYGSAFLTIENGGSVTSDNASMSTYGGTNTEVLVTGAGSSWAAGEWLTVGTFGRARLFVRDGASSSTEELRIAHHAGGDGGIEISGAGSQMTATDYFQVGDNGHGYLSITDGGDMTSGSSMIARRSLGVGVATIAGAGSAWNAGTALVVAERGSGTVRVADGGALTVNGQVQVATIAGSTGVVVIGGEANGPAAAPGSIAATGIAFGAGDGEIVFNHTDENYDFDLALSGSGTITVRNGSTNLTADSSAFSGATNVESGTLLVNGVLPGIMNVHADGTLGGAGTVGQTTLFDGGAISPGNSIGTLTINGDLTFNVGSIYLVEIHPGGQSDLINVIGQVHINGGIVEVVPLPGNFPDETTYRILNSTDGINGQFSQVNNNLAFFDADLIYSPNSIDLLLKRNNLSFPDIFPELADKELANAITDLGQGNPVYDNVLTIDKRETERAVSSLRGSIHTSVRPRIREQTNLFSHAFVEQTAAARMAAAEGESGAYDSYARLGAATTASGPRVWGQFFSQQGSSRSGARPTSRERASGFATGVHLELTPDTMAGFAVGFGRSLFREGSEAAKTDHFQGAAIFSRSIGATTVSLGGGFGIHQIDTSRRVSFNNFSDVANANYTAVSGNLFSELTHVLRKDRFSLAPFGRISVATLRMPDLAERGGASALRLDSARSYEVGAAAGVRARANFEKFTIDGSLGYRTTIGSGMEAPRRKFLAGGRSFSAPSEISGRDSLFYSASVKYDVSDHANFYLRYDGDRSAVYESHRILANFSTRF